MTTMTRRLEIDYGHRLVNHHGKCANVHGHRGVIEVTCSLPSSGVNERTGMVIDFSRVKEVFGSWLDEHLDHTFIANEKDAELIDVIRRTQKKPVYVVTFEPTSENLAEHLLEVANTLLAADGVVVDSLTFYETPSCKSTAHRLSLPKL